MNEECEILVHKSHTEYRSLSVHDHPTEGIHPYIVTDPSAATPDATEMPVHDIDIDDGNSGSDDVEKRANKRMTRDVGIQDNTSKLPELFKHKHWTSNFLNVSLLFHNGRELKRLARARDTDRDSLWAASLAMVGVSVLLQTVVGVLLTIGSFYKVNTEKENVVAARLSRITTILVLFTTIINVLLFAFSDEINSSSTLLPPQNPLFTSST